MIEAFPSSPQGTDIIIGEKYAILGGYAVISDVFVTIQSQKAMELTGSPDVIAKVAVLHDDLQTCDVECVIDGMHYRKVISLADYPHLRIVDPSRRFLHGMMALCAAVTAAAALALGTAVYCKGCDANEPLPNIPKKGDPDINKPADTMKENTPR